MIHRFVTLEVSDTNVYRLKKYGIPCVWRSWSVVRLGDANVIIEKKKKGSIKSFDGWARCARLIRRKRGSVGVCYVPYTPYRLVLLCIRAIFRCWKLKEDRQTVHECGRMRKRVQKHRVHIDEHDDVTERRRRKRASEWARRRCQSFPSRVPYCTARPFVLRERPKRRIMWQGAREK